MMSSNSRFPILLISFYQIYETIPDNEILVSSLAREILFIQPVNLALRNSDFWMDKNQIKTDCFQGKTRRTQQSTK